MVPSKQFSVLRDSKTKDWVQPKAIVMGNFDGLHLGHQSLIRACLKAAKDQNLPGFAVSFDPHPQSILAPPHRRLMSLNQQQTRMSELGLDGVIYLEFNQQMREMPADRFLSEVLSRLNPKMIFVGQDFRFGKGRAGGLEDLKSWGSQNGVFVTDIAPIKIETEVVSTSKIKALLAEGKLEEVSKFLGKNYSLRGQVVKGMEQGRKLGFPTANITLPQVFLPEPGVYAVMASMEGADPRPAVCHLGPKPTFGIDQKFLEVHLIDWAGFLYDKWMNVEFQKQLRKVKQFSSLDELKDQIKQDINQAKAILGASK